MTTEMTDVETAARALNLAIGDLAQGACELSRSLSALWSEDRPVIAISFLDTCESRMRRAEEMMCEVRKIVGRLDVCYLVDRKAPTPPRGPRGRSGSRS